MKPKNHWIEKRHAVRNAAEKMVSGLSPTDGSSQPADAMLHELLVHKVELEMQIDELRRIHDTMEDARDRYMELYDFAPVGYITLDQEGVISEINLPGAALLGLARSALIDCRFYRFISPRDQEFWTALLPNMINDAKTDRRTFVLEMIRADGATFFAYIECQRRQKRANPPALHLALFEMSKIKQAEQEMIRAANRFELKT
jgi:PAS domain S-box-containing protein